MDGKELSSVLVKMSVSPVKADRDAIARIERECGVNIEVVAISLENSQLMEQAILDTKPKPKILATGLFWCGVIGIAMLFIRPSYTVYGVGLGFLAGASSSIVWNE